MVMTLPPPPKAPPPPPGAGSRETQLDRVERLLHEVKAQMDRLERRFRHLD